MSTIRQKDGTIDTDTHGPELASYVQTSDYSLGGVIYDHISNGYHPAVCLDRSYQYALGIRSYAGSPV